MNRETQEILVKVTQVVVTFLYIIYCYLEAFYRFIVPPEKKSIDGETILITGAAGGIGSSLAKLLNRSGQYIKLVLWDVNLPALEKLTVELQLTNSTTKVFPFCVDISRRENIEAACQAVKEKAGPVSILFNNAGILISGNFLQISDEQIEKTMQVNLMSNIWIVRQLLPDMLASSHGRIVSICSLGGLKAFPNQLAYYVSKYGQNGFTEALKSELHTLNCTGIHLTTVYPSIVQTPLIKTLKIKRERTFRILPPDFQHFLKSEDIARRAVNGMRRELEHVYCPSFIPLALWLEFMTPLKVRKLIIAFFCRSLEYKDEHDQKR